MKQNVITIEKQFKHNLVNNNKKKNEQNISKNNLENNIKNVVIVMNK